MTTQLPPGFVLDTPPAPALPEGFTLDPAAPKVAIPGQPTPEEIKAAVAAHKSTVPPKGPTGMGERFLQGLADPIVGAAQIADKVIDPVRQLVSPGAYSMNDVVRRRDADYVEPEGMDWARIAGNVANPVSWAGGGAGVGKAVGMGAIQGALGPTAADDDITTFLLKKAGQAGLGAAAGRLGAGKATPEAKQLTAQGVRLTPGQAAGGLVGDIEQKMTSLPVTGKIIQNARKQAVEDVQSAAVARATGMQGIRTIDDANRAVSGLYKQSVPHMHPNPEGISEAANALNRALQNPELTTQHKEILTGLFDKHFENYASLNGEGLQKLQSQLGYLGRKYSGHNASPADQSLAEALYDVLGGLREGLAQGMSPEAAATLRQANKGFREMIPINKAASSRADEIATPRALQKAMARQAQTDVTRMPPDALIDPAVKLLGNNVPDSGTAGRLALTSPIASLTGVAAAPFAWAANTGPGRWLTQGTSAARDRITQALVAALRGEQAGGGE